MLEVGSAEGDVVLKALAHPTRTQILSLLADGDQNIQELGAALGIGQPTVTKHIQQLERAGLVLSELTPGNQGLQKRCRLRHDRMILSIEGTGRLRTKVQEIPMPIGLFTLANVSAPCGIASRDRLIGETDRAQSFLRPERATAGLLWASSGFVEYAFPCMLPPGVRIGRIEFVAELCSECPVNNLDYPSDITVWMNSVEIGTWTSPGDFGDRRGLLTPLWWSDYLTQYGMLKVWSVDDRGSYIDGVRARDVSLERALIRPEVPITIRLGCKPDARNAGGFNLFGSDYGNYAQDLLLRIHYHESEEPPPEKQKVRALSEDD